MGNLSGGNKASTVAIHCVGWEWIQNASRISRRCGMSEGICKDSFDFLTTRSHRFALEIGSDAYSENSDLPFFQFLARRNVRIME